MGAAVNAPQSFIVTGDCIATLRTFPDACIDSVVTDPPYELGFMGKKWDASGIAFSVELWCEVLRVLKPGGHLLAFSGTRTYHRMVCAIEDAGFEIRDQLAWMYGTGFPKSLDYAADHAESHIHGFRAPKPEFVGHPQVEGWGTALKPAQEPIVLARKPLIGTVAANVLAHGTGGIHVDACRIGPRERTEYGLATATRSHGVAYGEPSASADFDASLGRWPANVLLDETAAAMLDAQSGVSKDGAIKPYTERHDSATSYAFAREKPAFNYGGSGGASRFFYVAKASKAEREAGLEHLPVRTGGELTDRVDGSAGLESPRAGAGRKGGRRNHHPTVKPIELMRYLVRLVTPPGGLVLDPFTGSGTTGCAAALEGFGFVGCELSPEYVQIAESRIAHWRAAS